MKHFMILLSVFLFFGCFTRPPKEYILEEKDLVPEGIACSEKQDAFFLTSIAKSKIIAIDRKTGKQTDLISPHEYGYSPGVGIYADDEQDLLYAIGGYYMLNDSVSSLYTFDLRTRTLLKRYDLTGDHFLNDLVKAPDGSIYLTDTKGSAVYILEQERDSLEVFYRSPEIAFPNGIAISDDNTRLYIASHTYGVRILEIPAKKLLNTRDTTGISQGIDGLEFHNGHLYAIQNGIPSNSDNFRKLILNPNQDRIIDVEVIAEHTSDLNLPLTFCICDQKAVVIGNSNLQYLDQENFRFTNSDTVPHTKLVIYPVD